MLSENPSVGNTKRTKEMSCKTTVMFRIHVNKKVQMSSDEAEGSQLNWDVSVPLPFQPQQEVAPSGSKAFCTVAKETCVCVWVGKGVLGCVCVGGGGGHFGGSAISI